MLAVLDDAVGEILGTLRALNIESNTLIFFTSDNGAPAPDGVDANGSVNQPLRGYKADLYEGGIRVPFLVQWKGQLASNVVDALVSTLDILPTAVAAAGGAVQPAWQLDGVNLLPYLLGQTTALPHTNLFWRLETAGGDGVPPGPRALRQGDWKLVKPSRDDSWELYDLATDLSETNNLADAHPEVVGPLVAAYDAWNAQLANPRWDFNTLYYEKPEFVREDVRIGSTNVSYLAPVFLPGGAHVAFQNGLNQLWVGALDPLTGFLISPNGQDFHVDSGLPTPAGLSAGAQWGLSTNAPALFYTKTGGNAHLQIWRARPPGNSYVAAPLTSGQTNDSFGARVSQEKTDPSVKLAFQVGNLASSTMSYADETAPSSIVPLPGHAGGSRNGNWLPGSADIVYSSLGPQSVFTQITRYRTATGTSQILSTNAGNKTDVWGFPASELDGELCFAAVVNHTNIAIYRDLHNNTNGFFTQLVSFGFPANAPQRYIYSLEPLPGLRGFNGASYFSFTAFANNDPDNPGDSAMWLLGLGPDLNHPIIRRVDADPLATNNAAVAGRRDPKLFIGEREVFYYYSLADGTNPVQLRLARTGVKYPDYPGAPSGFTSLQFTRSFTAGAIDVNTNLMNPTEIMNLVVHQGRLYAGQSSTRFFPYPTNAEITNRNPAATWSGAQILVKTSPTAPWQVDDFQTDDLFRVHLRVDALAEISLTTTILGTSLRTPTNLLVCGLLDIGNIGAKLASARTRIDETGRWYESQITQADEPASALSFGSHMDRVTGVHRIFAGLSNGQIHRGGFAPNLTNKLSWNSTAELSGGGPVTSFAECNGFLYAASGLRQNGSNTVVNDSLFVRNDASNSWQQVYQWLHPVNVSALTNQDFLMRGLTSVPEPHGASNEVLLAARAWPGVIERIDPAKNHAVTVELDVRDFYARLWNDDRVRQTAVTIAYNGFTAVTNPVSGERVHLVGVWIEHPNASAPSFRGSHFLIRHLDGTYENADLLNDMPGGSLRTTRCIAASPFAEERNSFYFGGYDVANDPSTNSAWILRGDWLAWPALMITRPSPPEWQLDWPLTETSWELETSPALGPSADWQLVPGLSTRSLAREFQSVNPETTNAYFRLRKP